MPNYDPFTPQEIKSEQEPPDLFTLAQQSGAGADTKPASPGAQPGVQPPDLTRLSPVERAPWVGAAAAAASAAKASPAQPDLTQVTPQKALPPSGIPMSATQQWQPGRENLAVAALEDIKRGQATPAGPQPDLTQIGPRGVSSPRAGQGQPIQVIRGVKSTYFNENPKEVLISSGATPEHVANLEQIASFFNPNYAKYGTGLPAWAVQKMMDHYIQMAGIKAKGEYELKKAAALGKTMEVSSGLAHLDQKQAHDYLNNMLLSQYGITDPEDKTGKSKILPDFAHKAMLQGLPKIKTMADVEGFLAQMDPELETGKQIDLYNNPASRETSRAGLLVNARKMAPGGALNPEAENYLKNIPVTKENLSWFRQFQGTKTSAPAPKPPSLEAAAKAKPVSSDQENEPEVFDPVSGAYYGRYTGKPHEVSSLTNLATSLRDLTFGTPEDWRKAYEKEQTERKKWKPLPAMAAGGPVDENRPYLVGEEGPEIFVPQQQGAILPNGFLDLSALANGAAATSGTARQEPDLFDLIRG